MPSVTALSRTISGPIGLHEGSKELPLVETMQLVEPRREKTVPNHLLETKIYSKVSQNAMVLAKPAIIHFGGFEVDKKHVQSLQIVNASTEVINMHIIPPQTKYFYIKYKKTERLVPGLTIDCTIEFSPDEWRYYYDSIRINCPGEENLVIPIHAYPVMSTKDFPTQFSFPPVPVGHKMTQLFPLRCEGPVDFEYQLIYVQPHPSFTVHPMNGIIPAHGQTEVSVTFAPLEFQTALMKIQLTISQFNSQPIVCTFTGVSTPGLLKDISMQNQEIDDNVLDPRCLSPLDRSREKRKLAFKIKPRATKQQTPQIQEVEYNGVRFPPKLNTPFAVAQVLNQEPGKLRAKDLRDTVLAQKQTNKPATRQMKEAMFEHKVRQNVYEERQNQLRWQVKLGDDQITNSDRAQILEDRDQAWKEYKYDKRGDPVIDEEYKRTETKCTFRRTFRDHTDLAPETAMFDTYSNDLWATRHAALGKFAQAARKVVIHMRANWKVKVLKKVVQDILEQERNVETRTALLEKKEKEEEMELIPHEIQITADKIKKFTFPIYVPPNVKDDMAPDALGKVPYKPSEVVVKRKVPFFGLKVPKHYSLLGYDKHLVHEASRGYVAPKLPRPLRTGAEDESIRISVPVEEIEAPPTEAVAVEDATQEVVREGSAVKKTQQVVALTPPKALFQPIEYPSLHIFNPAPGLQVFQAPVPYSETDSDFHLCPIPTYFKKDHATNPHSATQRRYLDREDTIRGIMGWKKFPSQGLTSLANTPTLTSVWVPRWDDQFGSDLLPEEVPVLLDQLPEDDRQNIEDEDHENFTQSVEMTLTPDMVAAQFSIIDPKVPTEEKIAPDSFPHGNKLPSTNIPVSTYGPVPREKREEELEYFMTKKYNRLGSKIQTRNTTLSNIVTDPDLLLK